VDQEAGKNENMCSERFDAAPPVHRTAMGG
jgi:hypothetical protein